MPVMLVLFISNPDQTIVAAAFVPRGSQAVSSRC
jgi:hypothetical protein